MRKVLDVPLGERRKAVLLEKVEDAHAVQLRHDTGVIAIIKVFVEVDTFTARQRFPLTLRKQATDNEFAGSCALSVSSTLISILLASLYFWTARMTLMATLRRDSICLASTTLPKVP